LFLSQSEQGSGPRADESVQHLVQYNTAVALVQQEQFASASNILESLFRRIEPCDEWVAMRAAFLLLDIYARAFPGTDSEDNNLGMVTQKARAVLTYLEQPHVFTDANAAAACLSVVLPSSVAAAAAPGGGSGYAAAAGRAVVQHFQCTLAVHRARFALAEGALSTAMQYLKQAFDILGSGAKGGEPGFHSVLPSTDAADLGGITTAVKPAVTSPGWVPLHSTRQMAMSLRAEVALRRRHFQRACRITQATLGESETIARKLPGVAGDRGLQMAQYLNNLGVAQAVAGKSASAVLLLTKAVDAALAHNTTHGLTPAMSHAARTPAGGDAAGTAAGGSKRGGRKGGGGGSSRDSSDSIFPERNAPSSKRKPAPHTHLAAGGGVTPPRIAPMGDILSNLGLALLLCRQPARALTALHGAAPSRRHQPRLWLRMAEACLQAHSMRTASGPGHAHAMPVVPTDAAGATVVQAAPDAAPDAFATDGGDDGRNDNVGDGGAEICWAGVGLVSAKLGGGAQQRLLLSCARADTEPPAALPAVGARAESDASDICSVRPQLNLSYAMVCLLNCVALLPHPATLSSHMNNTLNQAQGDLTSAMEEHRAAKERGGEATHRVMTAQATGRAAAMRCLRWGQCRVRQAALCKLAYAALCRGDPHTAISACQQVWSIAHLLQPALNSAQLMALHTANVPAEAAQSIQSLADPWRFLAYSYMCEALCTLGRVRDGMQYLARAVPPSEGQQQAQGVSIPKAPAQGGVAPQGEALFPLHLRVPLSAPSTVPRVAAVSAMYTNVAIAHILTGEYETAATSAAQALQAMPSCVYARGLSAYLSLRRAAFGEAAALVNRGLVHSRPAAAPSAAAAGTAASAAVGSG